MGRGLRPAARRRGLTDEELRAAIAAARPGFEARVAAGEVKVRGTLSYDKRGACIRPDPGPGPLLPLPLPAWGHVGS